jgi:hypothetical protein
MRRKLCTFLYIKRDLVCFWVIGLRQSDWTYQLIRWLKTVIGGFEAPLVIQRTPGARLEGGGGNIGHWPFDFDVTGRSERKYRVDRLI